MKRSSSVILVVTSLAAGLVLGFAVGRGGPVVSAQVEGSARGPAVLDGWRAFQLESDASQPAR